VMTYIMIANLANVEWAFKTVLALAAAHLYRTDIVEI
jgi:hypothetical protein